MAKPHRQRKNKLTARRIFRKLVKSMKYVREPSVYVPSLIFVLCLPFFLCLSAIMFSSMDDLRMSGNLTKADNWSGPFQINHDLARTRWVKSRKMYSPKSVLFNLQTQSVYVIQTDGMLHAVQPDSAGQPGLGRVVDVSYLPGNPVGLQQSMGMLFVADALNGVYVISQLSRKPRIMVGLDCVEPAIKSLVDFAVGFDGTVYMLDSNNKYPVTNMMVQLLEGSCTGRVIKYNLVSKKATVLKEGLCVPSGVDITMGNRLLIAESGRGRLSLMRINDSVIERHVYLPGLPGRVRSNNRGSVWVALQAKKESFFQFVRDRLWLRKLLTTFLSQSYLKSFAFQAHVVMAEVHQNATPIDSLHDTSGKIFQHISDVTEGHDGQLFICDADQNVFGKFGEKSMHSTSGQAADDAEGSKNSEL